MGYPYVAMCKLLRRTHRGSPFIHKLDKNRPNTDPLGTPFAAITHFDTALKQFINCLPATVCLV